jgi:hypothetical protein
MGPKRALIIFVQIFPVHEKILAQNEQFYVSFNVCNGDNTYFEIRIKS